MFFFEVSKGWLLNKRFVVLNFFQVEFFNPSIYAISLQLTGKLLYSCQTQSSEIQSTYRVPKCSQVPTKASLSTNGTIPCSINETMSVGMDLVGMFQERL